MHKALDRKTFFKVLAVILLLVAIISVVVLFIEKLLRGESQYLSVDSEETQVESLYCTAHAADDTFFTINNATDIEYTLKIVFGSSTTTSIDYALNIVYPSNEIAKLEKAMLSSQYNSHTQKQPEYFRDIYSNFRVIDNEVKIDFIINASKVNEVNRVLFQTGINETVDFLNYSKTKIKKIYENGGYHCNLITY